MTGDVVACTQDQRLKSSGQLEEIHQSIETLKGKEKEVGGLAGIREGGREGWSECVCWLVGDCKILTVYSTGVLCTWCEEL